MDKSVKIGPSSEVKSSIICFETAIAHLNYIGNSIIGQNVNFEAGSIAANHYNEFRSETGAIFEEVSTRYIRSDSVYSDPDINDMDPMDRKTVIQEG